MRKSYQQLIPGSFELWCVALVAIAILVAGNAKLFLQRYGLINSSALVQAQLSHKVNNGLGTIDSFTVTPTLITFLTWGIIGLVLFSLIHAFFRASSIIKYERELSSNLYVHPQSFNRQRYWKHIIIGSVLSFVFIVFLAIGAFLYCLLVLPVGFAYVQRFLLHISLPHTVDLLGGLFAILIGTLIVYLLLKLVVWHHHLSQQ